MHTLLISSLLLTVDFYPSLEFVLVGFGSRKNFLHGFCCTGVVISKNNLIWHLVLLINWKFSVVSRQLQYFSGNFQFWVNSAFWQITVWISSQDVIPNTDEIKAFSRFGITLARGESDAKSDNKDEKMHGYSLLFDAVNMWRDKISKGPRRSENTCRIFVFKWTKKWYHFR